jgi:hypothetical protein
VGDEEDRLPRAGDRGLAPHAQQLEVHLVARHGVQRAERLVHQEQRRIEQQRAAEGRALLHAAGELARALGGEVFEPDEAQQLRRALVIAPRVAPRQLRGEQDVLEHAAPVQQHRRLEHHPDLGDGAPDRMVRDLHAARGRRAQPGHDAEQRRLAAARGTDERDELAARDGEGDVAEGFDRAGRRLVRHADPVEDDQRPRWISGAAGRCA